MPLNTTRNTELSYEFLHKKTVVRPIFIEHTFEEKQTNQEEETVSPDPITKFNLHLFTKEIKEKCPRSYGFNINLVNYFY